MTQHSYENSMTLEQPRGQAALGLGPSSASQLCSAPRGLLCTGLGCASLLWSHIFNVADQPGRCSVQSSRERESDSQSHGQEALPLDPDRLVLMPIRALNPLGLIDPKDTVLIGENRATLVGWSCSALVRRGKPPSYWLK